MAKRMLLFGVKVRLAMVIFGSQDFKLAELGTIIAMVKPICGYSMTFIYPNLCTFIPNLVISSSIPRFFLDSSNFGKFLHENVEFVIGNFLFLLFGSQCAEVLPKVKSLVGPDLRQTMTLYISAIFKSENIQHCSTLFDLVQPCSTLSHIVQIVHM